ncbi:Na+/H+ antiporter NhaC family protein [Virgibacillus dakarensis]|uniref:Tetracycline efflux Na+/H+ antiporter family transporter Tet(35) n=1 Tax=Lentibacillus populi TaxID=1827502 RepID=A0A9W5X4Z2_9BACI|nr:MULTISPECIES: Na+/H+ antiporter NhaC family protein [Bacillaceae]MBT2217105.1 Na+/H+ antiporter NhaC family protein [Virgibacillus dakarensis]MTW84701.1 Na+/H+ antiporter NhaC family protein [Virgibacillus dakarensis]GGB36518.1 tetracycline efflux Na+/H+ antiporter family transporter Tet(35) [Lentibacillus populi]
MEGTIYSLIPAVLMLVLVLLTRKVLLSLGAGIIVGALFIHDFNILGSLNEIWETFYTIFVSNGRLNTGNILLLSFLLFLGIMTAFITASGGSREFGDWMMKRVKTRVGAQVMTAILGIIIFIDDYFNALAVGQIARPLTDRHRVSRAKLAYFIDSTSAPVTVISPISSWGAYIIGLLGSLFAANGITDIQPLEAFIKMIPYNFYAIGALLLVFLVACMKIDFGPMLKHENRAIETGEVVNSNEKVPGDLQETFKPHENGKVYHLIVPILVLVVATVTAMIVTGYQDGGDASLLTIFANTNVNVSLFTGGLLAVLTAFIFHLSQRKPKANVGNIIWEGIKAMLPAIYILLLAWMIGSIISTLETGDYLARLVNDASINPALLPFLFFIIAGFMALATGTSWGTFGIMLPIAAEVTVLTDVNMLLPTLAAVLAGSVFGDHCSPISDTTILSSTGAGVNHIDHVLTQLPYALLVALASCVGYLVIGWTNQMALALCAALIVLIIIGSLIHFLAKTRVKN